MKPKFHKKHAKRQGQALDQEVVNDIGAGVQFQVKPVQKGLNAKQSLQLASLWGIANRLAG